MKTGLKSKLILITIGVGTIPLVLAMILSYFQGKKSLMEVIGSSFKALAYETSTKVDLLVKDEIFKISHLAGHPTLILSVTEHNKSFKEVQLNQVPDHFKDLALNWKNQNKIESSPVNNRASQVLKDFIKDAPNASSNTIALFITNNKGVLISSVNLYPDFLNSERASWTKIMTKKMDIFIGPLSNDKLTKRFIIEISVPIKNQDGEKIGVLHRIYDAKEFFVHSLDPITFGKSGHVMLINSEGMVLTCPILPTGFRLSDPDLVKAVTWPSASWAQTQGDGHGSEDTSIIGFSPLEQASRHTLASTNQQWFTFAWQASEELFAPTESLLNWVSGAGMFSILLIIIMGSLAANRIVEPIRKLEHKAVSIGRGEKTDTLEIKTGDEIESLAKEINTMSELLQKKFSGLENQVEAQNQEILNLKKYTESILMSVPEVIVIFDPEQKIEYANSAFEKLTKKFPSDFLGQRLGGVSLDFPSEWNQLSVELTKYKKETRIQSGSSLDNIASYTAKDPLNPMTAEPQKDKRATVAFKNKIYAYQFFDVFLDNKEPQRVGLIMKDITEEKELLDQLTQADKLAGLGTLAAGIAHEINNPLYSVMAYTEAIAEQENIPKIRELADKVLKRSKHMASVILNLSGYTRANTQDVIQEVDVNERLDGAVEMALMSLYSDDIDIVKNYNTNAWIKAKPEEIQQAFLNIINNAVQAMEGKGRLEISSRLEGGHVLIDIQDTGPGIPKEHISKVFDPFFTTREVGKGTGLGLNIVHRVVEKYGGNIKINSEMNQGTTVTISLPQSEQKGGADVNKAMSKTPEPSV